MAKRKVNSKQAEVSIESDYRERVKSPRKKSTSEFWEKYKHPKWQEMRLRVMQRAEFRCEDCACEDETLNVHHGFYVKGKDPWDYPESSFSCLCESCHESRTEMLAQIRRLTGNMPNQFLVYLLGTIKGCMFRYGCDVELNNDDEAMSFCTEIGLDFFSYSWPWFNCVDQSEERVGEWSDEPSDDDGGEYSVLMRRSDFQEVSKCQAQNEPATSAEQSESK